MENMQIKPLQYGFQQGSPKFAGGIKPETRYTQSAQTGFQKGFDYNQLARFDYKPPVVADNTGICESGLGGKLNCLA